ncbi:MAG: ABC transporter permease [Caulobacter sp.]|nr:ABC transporter permease [Caulobacter sp.]
MTTTSPPDQSMAGALSIQLRVIVALVLRELVHEFGESKSAVFWVIFKPAFIAAMFYAVAIVTHQLTPQGMPLMAFVVTGWAAYFLFMDSMKDTSGKVRGGSGLLMFPQMTALDIYLAQAIKEWIVNTFVFCLFVIFALIVERSPAPANALQVILSFWSCGLIGSLLGIILSSVARVVPAVDHLSLPIRRMGQFVSGVIVTAADTPTFLLPYMSWNPLFHAIELMREAWWPAYVSPIADAWYLFRCLFFMAATGLILERATRRYLVL